MTNKFKYIGMLSFFLYSSIALSANYTGKVQSLHVNMTSNTAHVQFEGKPKINQSGCSDSWWTGNSLDDQKFMKYIWPLLMTAQAKGEEVTINTNGCNGSHANIYWIDYKPRL